MLQAHDLQMTAYARSGRNCSVQSYESLSDGPFQDRPMLSWVDKGSYPSNTQFICCSNDDKNEPADQVQTTLVVSGPVTCYLDFWGGEQHASLGFATWNTVNASIISLTASTPCMLTGLETIRATTNKLCIKRQPGRPGSRLSKGL